MSPRTRRPAARLCALALLAFPGCLGQDMPRTQEFMLAATPPATPAAEGGGSARGVLRIHRVRVAPMFERKGFVYRTGEETYRSDFHNRFWSPPGVLLRKATVEWLSAAGIVRSVLTGADQGEADWMLDGRALKLFADVRDENDTRAVMELEFKLLDARAPTLPILFEKRYSVAEPTGEASAEAIASAWNRALAEILTRLSEDLSAEAAGR